MSGGKFSALTTSPAAPGPVSRSSLRRFSVGAHYQAIRKPEEPPWHPPEIIRGCIPDILAERCKMLNQSWYIVHTIFKRQNFDRYYIQAIKEILSKVSLRHLFFHIMVSRRDNPHISSIGFLRHAGECLILENADNIPCVSRGISLTSSNNVPSLACSNVPILGETPGLLASSPNSSASIRSGFIAAQFSTINEICPVGHLVQLSCEHFLTRARGASNQNTAVCWRNSLKRAVTVSWQKKNRLYLVSHLSVFSVIRFLFAAGMSQLRV